MSEPYLGQIIMFGGNFAPRGWAFCNGQLLQIAQNSALFSLLGTNFGGDGRTTFGLPDLRGRVPVHCGNSQGPGLSQYDLGQMSGSENVTLITSQIPAHTHSLVANTLAGTLSDPTNAFIAPVADANSGAAGPTFEATGNAVMNPQSIGPAGGSQPHSNLQPYLGINFIIATEGIYPSRP